MPRAELFVVCKNPDCGQEVSPYVTECPYCGTRLRKRAPKLDRGAPRRRTRGLPTPALPRLRRGEIPGIRSESAPYATATLVVATCGVWIAWRGGWLNVHDALVERPLGNDWWRVATTQFTYLNGVYQFVTLFAVALFGWLVERRHGSLAVLLIFFIGGAGGAAATAGLDAQSIVSGANGGALALLCAWAVPDLLARSRNEEYDGDLLGASVFAIVLLAMPIARTEASSIAGGVGVVAGLVAGRLLLALSR